MKKYAGFTLAEVLITLAIIGVVAALTIPSVIANSNQQEFKTGLKKAVSVLNSAINMNIAQDGETPYENKDLFNYLQRHMSILKTTGSAPKMDTSSNYAFYTTDGMRFEIGAARVPLHEDPTIKAYTQDRLITVNCWYKECPMGSSTPCTPSHGCDSGTTEIKNKSCGAKGLENNPYDTTEPPCIILVDVNGDKKPNPQDGDNTTTIRPSLDGTRLSDVFLIMITDKEAIPYGTAAQKAMYSGRK